MASFISPKIFISPETLVRPAKIQMPSATPTEHGLKTFEEERQEVLASVLQSLVTDAKDPDRTSACFHLLRHLTSPHSAAPYC